MVEGKVFDLGNFEPIRLTNVFIVGTTMGAPTDSAGYFRFEVPRPGKYELVYSHIAYRPQIIEIEVGTENLVLDPMPLQIDTRFVDEVVVTARKDKAWKRQYERFINYAMGKHYREKKVEIANPYVVEFRSVGKGMLAEAEPFTLSIKNDFTGYEINFLVQRVFLSKTNQFMVGYPGFTPMDSENPDKLAEWRKNRERSYKGSLRHIFKSILDNDLTAQGFDIILTEIDPDKFTGPAAKILPLNVNNDINITRHNLWKYIEITDTDDPIIKKMTFEKVLKVTYLNESNGYGQPQQTMIEALEGEVLVYTNGIPVNPTSLKLYGYLSSEGLYEMLPFEYELAK